MQGYEPLIFEAKSKFLAVFSISQTDVSPSDRERLAYEHYYLLRTSRAYFEREKYRVPIAGYFSSRKMGLVFFIWHS